MRLIHDAENDTRLTCVFFGQLSPYVCKLKVGWSTLSYYCAVPSCIFPVRNNSTSTCVTLSENTHNCESGIKITISFRPTSRREVGHFTHIQNTISTRCQTPLHQVIIPREIRWVQCSTQDIVEKELPSSWETEDVHSIIVEEMSHLSVLWCENFRKVLTSLLGC